MISDLLRVERHREETALRQVVLRRRYRNIGLVVVVMLLHGLLLALLTRRPQQVHLVSDTAPAVRGAVSVTLVTAPTKLQNPTRPAQQSARSAVAPPPEKVTPHRVPNVLASEHPARRDVAKTPPVVPVPVPYPSRPAPPRSLPAVPETPAPTATAPSTPANAVPAVPPSPIPKGVPDAPSALAVPKPIGANQMGKLGCRIPAPDYPAKSRRLGQEGTVALLVTIGTDGRVTRATVQQSSGYPALDEAAVHAVQSGQCQPYREDGRPTIVETLQPIAFHLND